MGLSNEEAARLIISVGKGGSGGVRLLTPIQVASYIKRWMDSGLSLADVARKLNVSDSIVGRFVSLVKLSNTVQSLVEFNASATTLSFSIAHQISRIEDVASQESLARACLEFGLSSKAVEQVVQVARRSGKPVDEAVRAVLALTPEIERRHIILGEINSEQLAAYIVSIKGQAARDAWALSAIKSRLGADLAASVRVTPERFTISGNEQVFRLIENLKPDYETVVNEALLGAVSAV